MIQVEPKDSGPDAIARISARFCSWKASPFFIFFAGGTLRELHQRRSGFGGMRVPTPQVLEQLVFTGSRHCSILAMEWIAFDSGVRRCRERTKQLKLRAAGQESLRAYFNWRACKNSLETQFRKRTAKAQPNLQCPPWIKPFPLF